jgi:excinuclease ABC subunit A
LHELLRRAIRFVLVLTDLSQKSFPKYFEDVKMLLDVLNKLVDKGNTVIVIEHNMEVIKTADWIIDLGPEGGDAGGYIVAEGTPDEVARNPESYTGNFLRRELRVELRLLPFHRLTI